MWQRARILRAPEGFKWGIGRTIWVEGRPTMQRCRFIQDPIFAEATDEPAYTSHLLVDTQPLTFDPPTVELLPEFAEHVELEQFDTWRLEHEHRYS